ncbi:DUF423 domain-containing protein [Paenibacillus sp. HB172176]|uniref:DUF423 domain-containing protein n=1 Tax=Paenibacillus sp. HB172176 TaxID=2493690 RepID=UPI001438FABD|nr:DUF423 domain-containing protein [Paenibacillus sp. HB172176]
MFPKYFIIGAISAALAIAFGAFGAHGLEDRISEHLLDVFETGVRYQMYSALGLMLVSLMVKVVGGNRNAERGAAFIFAGMIIFSVSLYVLALTDISILGAITPIGGVAMLIGWVYVIAGAWKLGKQ